MPDARFFHIAAPLRAEDIAKLVNGKRLHDGSSKGLSHHHAGNPDPVMISSVADIAEENIGHACVYIARQKFFDGCDLNGPIGLCLIEKDRLNSQSINKLMLHGLVVEVVDAQLAYVKVAHALYKEKEIETLFENVNQHKFDDVFIHPTAVIADNVMIGQGSRIGAYSVIGPGVVLGKNCRIESHVTITHTIMGNDGHVFTGTRIGQAGFGFVPTKSGLVRVPQLGGVKIGNRVEVGANSTIDRSTLGNTIIGHGTCIDNQVQIAHNVEIGENCVFAAHVGISGSCKIGHNVMLGGKAGVADHLTIGNGARLAGNASTMHDIPDNETWAGSPARPIRQFMREIAVVKKLASTKKKEN